MKIIDMLKHINKAIHGEVDNKYHKYHKDLILKSIDRAKKNDYDITSDSNEMMAQDLHDFEYEFFLFNYEDTVTLINELRQEGRIT